MSPSRWRLSLSFFALFGSGIVSCKSGTKVTVAPEASAPAVESSELQGSTEPDKPHRKPSEPPVRVQTRLYGLSDMLAGVEKSLTHWRPDQAMNLQAALQATLMQLGFGPGFMEGLDLDGLQALDVAFVPDSDQQVFYEELDIVAAWSARDAKRVIESFPKSHLPQPQGNQIWRIVDDKLELLLRAQTGWLEVGRTPEALDRAAGLRTEKLGLQRLQITASNLPKDLIPIGKLESSIDKNKLIRMDQIVEGLETVQLSFDAGTERDFRTLFSAEGKFEKVHVSGIGVPLNQVSSLASALPDQAAMAMVWSLGNADEIQRDLESLSKQIPAPFDGIVDELVTAVGELTQQLREEAIVAAYIDQKMRATLVMASKVADDEPATVALRKLGSVVKRAFEAHIGLTGDNKDYSYKVNYKTKAKKSGKKYIDRFSWTVPEFVKKDQNLTGISMALDRRGKRLEAYSLVADQRVIIAIGANAKGIVDQFSKASSRSLPKNLELDGGLARARKLTEGCQFCGYVDPLLLMRGLVKSRHELANSSQGKELLAKLVKLELSGGQVVLSGRLDKQNLVMGIEVPSQLLYAEPKIVQAIHQSVAKFDSEVPSMNSTEVDSKKSKSRNSKRTRSTTKIEKAKPEKSVAKPAATKDSKKVPAKALAEEPAIKPVNQ